MGGITKQQHFLAKQEEEFTHGYSPNNFGMMESGRGFFRGRGGGFWGGGRQAPYPMGGRGGFGGRGKHPLSTLLNDETPGVLTNLYCNVIPARKCS